MRNTFNNSLVSSTALAALYCLETLEVYLPMIPVIANIVQVHMEGFVAYGKSRLEMMVIKDLGGRKPFVSSAALPALVCLETVEEYLFIIPLAATFLKECVKGFVSYCESCVKMLFTAVRSGKSLVYSTALVVLYCLETVEAYLPMIPELATILQAFTEASVSYGKSCVKLIIQHFGRSCPSVSEDDGTDSSKKLEGRDTETCSTLVLQFRW
eukprot:GHVQ01015539.1.p1 GENE.GHVQ01015539.1~~GHVQ01015539.1.p1  ORF type:complete len:212 (-),score=24.00 GHVQ01015539.1:396-1031(-)